MSKIERWPSAEFKNFRDLLLRMRHIDRDHLPQTNDWDADWPSFRNDPYRYFMVGPDKHQRDIWLALHMDRARWNEIKNAAVAEALANGPCEHQWDYFGTPICYCVKCGEDGPGS